MNQDQFLGIIRVILPLILPVLTAKGWVPASAVNDVTQAIIGLGSAIWVIVAHTTSAKIAAVTALPDVKKIITVPNPENPAVKQAVDDTSQPKVTDVGSVTLK
jgi:hypothetical protein